MAVDISKAAVSVTGLTWCGEGFSDPVASDMWQRLPVELREIAKLEIDRGNEPWNILRDLGTGIVLLAFRRPPSTVPTLEQQIRVHTSFEYGNYCYDGTFCTYQHLPSGCFLAFDDPDWQDEA